MRPGDLVVLRSVQDGRVQQAFPHVFALEHEGRLGFYLAPGTRGVRFGRDADGRFLARWARGDPARPHVWAGKHVLRLIAPTAAHALDLRWDERWRFLGWYVNLQTPLRPTARGFDYTDWALDLEVTPAGVWEWKDEADLAEAQALGILSPEPRRQLAGRASACCRSARGRPGSSSGVPIRRGRCRSLRPRRDARRPRGGRRRGAAERLSRPRSLGVPARVR